MSTMMAAKTPLQQRRDLLRIKGARHRLELAMAVETLVSETGGIRRGAGTVLSMLGMLAGGGRGGSLLRALGRGLIPVLLSLFAGSRAARTASNLRSTLEIGALGLIVYRYIRRVLRKPEEPPATP
jgi:hypothetical protein